VVLGGSGYDKQMESKVRMMDGQRKKAANKSQPRQIYGGKLLEIEIFSTKTKNNIDDKSISVKVNYLN